MMKNPLSMLQRAWNRTHSGWGKAGLILFYSFIWAQMLWGLSIVVRPLGFFPCFKAHATASETLLASSLMRQLNLWAIGLLLYADVAGLKLWNVAAVMAVYAVNTLLFFALMIPYDTELTSFVSCHEEHQTLVNVKFIFLGSILAAFVCTANETSQEIVDHYTTPVADQDSLTAGITRAPHPFNPVYRIRQAWTGTRTPWGKAAVILFYPWVWFIIVVAAMAAFDPLRGLPCLQEHFSAGDVLLAQTYLRELNVYALGFLLYADRGGVRPLHLLYVLAVYGSWVILHRRDFVNPLEQPEPFASSCPEDFDNLKNGSWTQVAWLAVAFILSLLEDWQRPANTVNTDGTMVDERTPINV